MPENLMVIENCDEYVVCINTNNGNILSWSHYDNDGMIVKQTCFEDYFINCIENAIDN
ncbi:SMI1/KNR4 family protein [Listeria monocytogenes]|nr:SMI1/KNR4 family protein [Listeria monocytogenes]